MRRGSAAPAALVVVHRATTRGGRASFARAARNAFWGHGQCKAPTARTSACSALGTPPNRGFGKNGGEKEEENGEKRRLACI